MSGSGLGGGRSGRGGMMGGGRGGAGRRSGGGGGSNGWRYRRQRRRHLLEVDNGDEDGCHSRSSNRSSSSSSPSCKKGVRADSIHASDAVSNSRDAVGAQEYYIRSSSSSARPETSSGSSRRRKYPDGIRSTLGNGTKYGYSVVADNSQSDDKDVVLGNAPWEIAVAKLLAIAEKEALAAEDAAGGIKRFFHAMPSDPDDHPEVALTFEETLRHNASSVEESERQLPSWWHLLGQQPQPQPQGLQEEEEQTEGTLRRRRRLSEDEGDERREEKEQLECDDVKIAEKGRVCKEVDASGCVLPQLSWPQILKGEQAPLSVTGQGVSSSHER